MPRTWTGRTVGRTVGRTLGAVLAVVTLLAVGAACPRFAPDGPRPDVVVPLPRPASDYVNDPDALTDFAKSLPWAEVEQDRACEGDGCVPTTPNGKVKRTRVEFAAPAYVGSVNLQALPANGVLVARFRNTGDRVEAKYKFDHGGFFKPIDYYVVLQRDPASVDAPGRRRAHVTLIRVAETRFDGKPPKVTLATRASFFRDCATGHPEPHKKIVDFIGCPSQTGDGGGVAVRGSEIDNAWIHCHHGCCYMGDSEQ